jgi:hypothetical protein
MKENKKRKGIGGNYSKRYNRRKPSPRDYEPFRMESNLTYILYYKPYRVEQGPLLLPATLHVQHFPRIKTEYKIK